MDPGTFTAQRLKVLRSLGLTRISMGIQSFNDEILKKCGRSHNVADVYNSVKYIGEAGINNFNVDLISSLPDVSSENWRSTLEETARINPSHISVYDLIVEENTPFSKWYSPGVFPLPNEEESRQMYSTAVETLTKHGYEHYEISNYAKPNFRSKHNQLYWRCEPFLGFGMGAASFLGNERFSRPKTLKTYYQWVDEIESDPSKLDTLLSLTQEPKPDLLEILMLALRTSDGLDLNKFELLFGKALKEKLVGSVQSFIKNKTVEITSSNRLRLVDPDGFIVSNDIISSIFASIV